MLVIRCYLPSEAWDQPSVRIDGPQAHHLLHVLRVKSGSVLVCFDGQGHEAAATVQEVSRKDLRIKLGERSALPSPPWTITLAVGIPKKGKFDQIVNEATQLGVDRIVPLLTARGVVKVPDRSAVSSNRSHDSELTSGAVSSNRSHARWVQISIEAGKQSGVGRLPAIQPATSWETMMGSIGSYDAALIATLQGPHESFGSLLSGRTPHRVLLLIGPEGDFTEEEIRQALRAGAHRISLGAGVLRCETAAVAAVSVVSFLLREGKKGQG
ncbi:MAG: 16S rRNA (uracil(1498)-N(3))-methyltransferase [Candidatus Omnitrophica bacterium]|nr:16S rRNA (uracil(1498)-N(3))-methyltransferase [Candidatus Omnitrophota bacterium]